MSTDMGERTAVVKAQEAATVATAEKPHRFPRLPLS